MDPQACWERIIDAINADDHEGAEFALIDLAEWIRNGGFLPKV